MYLMESMKNLQNLLMDKQKSSNINKNILKNTHFSVTLRKTKEKGDDMIRKIKEEDLTKVMTIWVKGNFKANSFIEKDYWLEIYNQVKVDFLENFKTYVYVENDEVLGFISVNENEIKAIFVKEENRGHEIGTKLLNYYRNNLEENAELFVKVFEKNMNGILVFSNLQFKNTKIQLNEQFNEKEYVMTWKKE